MKREHLPRRRGVADALPLLHKAQEVNIVEIVEGDEHRGAAEGRLKYVASWLKRHDGVSESHARRNGGGADRRIWRTEAGLVVAGAYGHTHLRARVFGGVTRNLMTRAHRCSFLTH